MLRTFHMYSTPNYHTCTGGALRIDIVYFSTAIFLIRSHIHIIIVYHEVHSGTFSPSVRIIFPGLFFADICSVTVVVIVLYNITIANLSLQTMLSLCNSLFTITGYPNSFVHLFVPAVFIFGSVMYFFRALFSNGVSDCY